MTDSFAGTAAVYGGRTAYLPKFFGALVDELNLDSSSRVLDAACGRGELAIGLSSYVGHVVAVDKSAEMLESVGSETPKNVEFRQAAIGENFDLDAGSFDLVTVGRASRYSPREKTCALFAKVLPPGRVLAACSSGISGMTPWRKTYDSVREAFGYQMGASTFVEQEYLRDSPFKLTKCLRASENLQCTISSLVQDSLSYRSLRDRIESNLPEYEVELSKALKPYIVEDGLLVANIVSIGMLFLRH